MIDTINEIQLRNNINANIDPIERKGLDIDDLILAHVFTYPSSVHFFFEVAFIIFDCF